MLKFDKRENEKPCYSSTYKLYISTSADEIVTMSYECIYAVFTVRPKVYV